MLDFEVALARGGVSLANAGFQIAAEVLARRAYNPARSQAGFCLIRETESLGSTERMQSCLTLVSIWW